jgi:hypothetical protein
MRDGAAGHHDDDACASFSSVTSEGLQRLRDVVSNYALVLGPDRDVREELVGSESAREVILKAVEKLED